MIKQQKSSSCYGHQAVCSNPETNHSETHHHGPDLLLTHKQLETCTVATDALVLQHQGISIHSAD